MPTFHWFHRYILDCILEYSEKNWNGVADALKCELLQISKDFSSLMGKTRKLKLNFNVDWVVLEQKFTWTFHICKNEWMVVAFHVTEFSMTHTVFERFEREVLTNLSIESFSNVFQFDLCDFTKWSTKKNELY